MADIFGLRSGRMDLQTHNAISGRLEEGRSRGWLSEYLVAWHGPSGNLSPNVTVWPAAERTEAEVRAYLAAMLSGFVTASDIVIERA